ncbi:hypothetical protein PanWU01x14_013410, partial [Parasponia andersonii]
HKTQTIQTLRQQTSSITMITNYRQNGVEIYIYIYIYIYILMILVTKRIQQDQLEVEWWPELSLVAKNLKWRLCLLRLRWSSPAAPESQQRARRSAGPPMIPVAG